MGVGGLGAEVEGLIHTLFLAGTLFITELILCTNRYSINIEDYVQTGQTLE